MTRPDQVSEEGIEYPKVVVASIMHQSGYRYTPSWNGTPQQRPTFKDLVGEELYDHYQKNQTAITIQNLRDSHPELLMKLRQMSFQWNGRAEK